MNTPEHQNVGALLHDRIIGALELCCRRGKMLMIQNKPVNWDSCQIGIPGETTKDKENRRIPFNPKGRVRRFSRGERHSGQPHLCSAAQREPTSRTSRPLGKPCVSRAADPKPGREGAPWNREQLEQIDLRWHDLRHEGACRLLADSVDIRIIRCRGCEIGRRSDTST